jgi:hypothetical protein
VVGTAVLQGVLLGIGLWIAGVPGATSLGFLGFVFSLSQVLGPLVILTWLGAAWWLYTSGTVGWAIFMVLWGIVLVSGSDSVVRPLLISRSVAMPMTLIILGVFGGLIASGLHTQSACFGQVIRSGIFQKVSMGGSGIEVNWPAPVRPGDEIGVTARIEETTPSRSKPDRGIVKHRITGRRVADGQVVIEIRGTMFMKR